MARSANVENVDRVIADAEQQPILQSAAGFEQTLPDFLFVILVLGSKSLVGVFKQ